MSRGGVVAPVARLATNMRAATLKSVAVPVVQALVCRRCRIRFVPSTLGTKVQQSGQFLDLLGPLCSRGFFTRTLTWLVPFLGSRPLRNLIFYNRGILCILGGILACGLHHSGPSQEQHK